MKIKILSEVGEEPISILVEGGKEESRITVSKYDKILGKVVRETEINTGGCGKCATCGFFGGIGADGEATGYCENKILSPRMVVDNDFQCSEYIPVVCGAVEEGEKTYFTIGRGAPWKHNKAIETETIEDAVYLRRFFEGIIGGMAT